MQRVCKGGAMYKSKEKCFIINVIVTVVFSLSIPVGALGADMAIMEELGKQLFFDKNLSHPKGRQSCASCHDPKVGLTAPDRRVNRRGGVMPGAIKSRFGARKVPTATYATFSADFSPDGGFGGAPEGGTFWDGRATGDVVTTRIFPDAWKGTPLWDEMAAKDTPAVDQAMGPFLNDVEMNLPSAVALCKRVASSRYVHLWKRAWDEPINCSTARAPVAAEDGLLDLTHADLTHQRIAFAIGVFEDTLNTFSSKRDIALLTDEDGAFPLDDFKYKENLGHDLFYDRTNSCAAFCHSSSFGADGTALQELYTPDGGSGYFNLGGPRNPANPFYRMDRVRDDNGNPINPEGRDFVDLGLGGRDDDGDGVPDFEGEEGKFKIPTMRNLFTRNFPRAYFHNGYFKSLKGVVHFYNTRDMKPVCANKKGKPQRFVTERRALRKGCWPQPEVLSENIFDCDAGENCKVVLAEGETFDTYCDNPDNVRDIGNLCLTEEEEDAIVAYLKTLTDTVIIKPPKKKWQHNK